MKKITIFYTVLTLINFNIYAQEIDIDSLNNLSTQIDSSNLTNSLNERNVISQTPIMDNSTEEGTVVLKICVNAEGNVVESYLIPEKSTTKDQDLINTAIEGSYKYKFEPAEIERQCGTMKIKFKIKDK